MCMSVLEIVTTEPQEAGENIVNSKLREILYLEASFKQ